MVAVSPSVEQFTLARQIRQFFPETVKGVAIQNLQYIVDLAFLRGKLEGVKETNAIRN